MYLAMVLNSSGKRNFFLILHMNRLTLSSKFFWSLEIIKIMAITVNDISYTQLMLHVTRYPSEPVWGLLLGTDSSTVTAIAPLFHSDLVASTLETSLMVVDQLLNNTASKWNGLQIIGCYVANRLIQSNSINSVTAKFGHAIRKDNNGQGCIVSFD